MQSLTEVLLLLFGILCVCAWYWIEDRKRHSNFPPGPLRLPLIGNLIHLLVYSDRNPGVAYKKLAEKYGDIMYITVGSFKAVMLTSLDAIQEMYYNENANGRYQVEIIKDRNDHRNVGVGWSWGETWETLRKFTIRNLRDFGFGKSFAMDMVTNEEIEKFHRYLECELEKHPQRIVHIGDLFTIATVNGLWRLVSGKSFKLDDPKIRRLMELNSKWISSTKVGMDVSDFYPKLRDWFPSLIGRTLQLKIFRELYDYAKELVDSHRKLSGNTSDPETFFDAFFQIIETEMKNPASAFNYDNMIYVLLDLLSGGAEAPCIIFNFAILYMIQYPEVQAKVQAEIDREVPPETPIDSSMKSRLPYTWATILEIQRFSTLVPIPFPREALADFYFRGCLIKKGTALMFNFHAINNSEALWADPKNFRPERFLTHGGGAVDSKTADQLKSFGAGPRSCLGQTLAETSIFLYFSSTLRKYTFSMAPGTNPQVEIEVGVTCSPKKYDVHVVKRNAAA